MRMQLLGGVVARRGPGHGERKGEGEDGNITVLWQCWSASNVKGRA